MAGATRRVEHTEVPAGGKAESILAAAKRTFLAAGFGAVSMDSIAREARVSKATVYAHFGSKEELFGAVIERECERYFASFSPGEMNSPSMSRSWRKAVPASALSLRRPRDCFGAEPRAAAPSACGYPPGRPRARRENPSQSGPARRRARGSLSP